MSTSRSAPSRSYDPDPRHQTLLAHLQDRHSPPSPLGIAIPSSVPRGSISSTTASTSPSSSRSHGSTLPVPTSPRSLSHSTRTHPYSRRISDATAQKSYESPSSRVIRLPPPNSSTSLSLFDNPITAPSSSSSSSSTGIAPITIPGLTSLAVTSPTWSTALPPQQYSSPGERPSYPRAISTDSSNSSYRHGQQERQRRQNMDGYEGSLRRFSDLQGLDGGDRAGYDQSRRYDMPPIRPVIGHSRGEPATLNNEMQPPSRTPTPTSTSVRTPHSMPPPPMTGYSNPPDPWGSSSRSQSISRSRRSPSEPDFRYQHPGADVSAREMPRGQSRERERDQDSNKRYPIAGMGLRPSFDPEHPPELQGNSAISPLSPLDRTRPMTATQPSQSANWEIPAARSHPNSYPPREADSKFDSNFGQQQQQDPSPGTSSSRRREKPRSPPLRALHSYSPLMATSNTSEIAPNSFSPERFAHQSSHQPFLHRAPYPQPSDFQDESQQRAGYHEQGGSRTQPASLRTGNERSLWRHDQGSSSNSHTSAQPFTHRHRPVPTDPSRSNDTQHAPRSSHPGYRDQRQRGLLPAPSLESTSNSASGTRNPSQAQDYGRSAPPPSTSASAASTAGSGVGRQSTASAPLGGVSESGGTASGTGAPGVVPGQTRRIAHLMSEQKRRESINTGFAGLRAATPSANEADSKAVVLRKATVYIQRLEEMLRQYQGVISPSMGQSHDRGLRTGVDGTRDDFLNRYDTKRHDSESDQFDQGDGDMMRYPHASRTAGRDEYGDDDIDMGHEEGSYRAAAGNEYEREMMIRQMDIESRLEHRRSLELEQRRGDFAERDAELDPIRESEFARGLANDHGRRSSANVLPVHHRHVVKLEHVDEGDYRAARQSSDQRGSGFGRR